MEAATRIYKVENTHTVHAVPARLVRAANSTQARNHVARESISVKVASQDDLIELAGTVPVEVAGSEPADSE
jgi:hypothetical protein